MEKINFLGIFSIAALFFVVSYSLVPLLIRLANRLDIIDHPNQAHKTHSYAIPYLGGFAIVIPLTLGSLLAPTFFRTGSLVQTEYISFLAAPIALSILGAIDDKFKLPPAPRFYLQVVTSILVLSFFVSKNWFGNPFQDSRANFIISLFWLVGITNSLNFFDNLDGGAAGFSVIASFTIFVIAYVGNQQAVALVSIALCGSCLGFLVWNRTPARIYLGDAGALFVGMLLAIVLIRLKPTSQSSIGSFLIPVFVMMMPILDTSVAILSRLRRRISPFKGGKDHLSHRLQRLGMSRKVSAIVLWSLSIFFCFFAVVLQLAPRSYVEMSGVLGLVSSFVVFVWFFRQPHQA